MSNQRRTVRRLPYRGGTRFMPRDLWAIVAALVFPGVRP